MSFCEKCGSHMKQTRNGLYCAKCRITMPLKPRKIKPKTSSDAVYVIDKPESTTAKVFRLCPHCKNEEAFQWTSNLSGEHAGVNQERTVRQFKCTRCSHSWTEST